MHVCLTYFVSGRMTSDAEDTLEERRDHVYKHMFEKKEEEGNEMVIHD